MATCAPASTSRIARLLPMKPSPPVIRTFLSRYDRVFPPPWRRHAPHPHPENGQREEHKHALPYIEVRELEPLRIILAQVEKADDAQEVDEVDRRGAGQQGLTR